MTQEKMIQAFGRVGRSNAQNNYSLRIIKANIIKRYWRHCTCNPVYKLARKLVPKRAGIE